MIIRADSSGVLPLEDGSVQTVVTSPPYWGLRDYGVKRQLGLERTPEEYVERLVGVFREVWRVLRDDGTAWLNLGDSFIATRTGGDAISRSTLGGGKATQIEAQRRPNKKAANLKTKDLVGIPWRVAFALQADGWYLRSDIIWHKPNPMPESVTDRPTKSHEYLFLLSKSAKYYYDREEIKEEADPESVALMLRAKGTQEGKQEHMMHAPQSHQRGNGTLKFGPLRRDKQRGHGRRHDGFNERWDRMSFDEQRAYGANKRDVWTVATEPSGEEHYAAYPQDLIKPCILAGAPEGGVVFDPFVGTGTTVKVAQALNRKGIGCDLDPKSCAIARRRTAQMTLC